MPLFREAAVRFILLVLAVLIIPACGSSDSGFTETPPPPILPAAVVPEAKKVLVNATGVALDGSKSHDNVAGAPPLTFSWTQTSGAPVTLTNATTATATFTAPSTPGDLVFKLTVSGAQGSDSASVTVSVKTFIVTAPDTWFAGYGVSGTITPVVTGTTTAPTYLWTGLEPWLITGSPTALGLTYTTPSLTDFQNFPDRVDVIQMQRTTQGRLQLKIKVTDGSASDEDFVNFSAGPFADSVANENVALGEPVFLNGAALIPKPSPALPVTITTWTWTGLKPNNSAVAFKKPNKTAATTSDRYVYFVPDMVGTYSIDLVQSDGTINNVVAKHIDVVCGKYVGIGNFTGTTPDPFVGECAACHAGQLPWLANFADPWKQTHHATVFSEILDPVNPFFTASQAKNLWVDFFNFGSEYSIDSRTVGWSRPGTTSNNGWADTATTEGCMLAGSSWDDVIRRHPKTAARSNVQCENCHGPGSEHAGDSTAIRKSYDSLVCGRCHSSRNDLWENSGHASVTSNAFNSASGSTSCNGCHTAQGFIVEMRAQEGQDPHPVLFAVGNAARPVVPLDDRRSETCQTCHEPHKKTVGRPAQPGPDPQLRAWGNAQFRNNVVAFAGEAAVCYMCHQSRTDARVNSVDWNSRRAPHDSTAAEMLSGTNGMEFAGWTYSNSPHADKSRFVVAGASEARQCLTCHNDVTPSKGQTGFQGLGGHSFKMSQGDGTSTINNTTFGGATTTASSLKFTLSAAAGTQTLLRKIFTGDILVLTGGADAGSYIVDSVDGARQVTVKAAGAFTGFLGSTPTSWSLTSVPKYNTAACAQCHTTGAAFENVARGDYDGSGGAGFVQDEITGLRASLLSAVEAQLSTLVGSPSTVTIASGRVKYTITASGLVRTFPGPSVTASDNPDINYSALPPAQKAQWDALYGAAYDWVFVGNDNSNGVHNTGYAVNLLQSAYKAVTGTTIGTPFVPF